MEDAGSPCFRRFHQICEQGSSFNDRCLHPLAPSPGLSDYCLKIALGTDNMREFIGPRLPDV